jgi:hypothetical protein
VNYRIIIYNKNIPVMTLKEFTEMSEHEQIRMLVVYGVLLAERYSGYNHIYLYAVSSFYIELFHQLNDTENSCLRILKAFDDVKHLDEYLREIHVPATF